MNARTVVLNYEWTSTYNCTSHDLIKKKVLNAREILMKFAKKKLI